MIKAALLTGFIIGLFLGTLIGLYVEDTKDILKIKDKRREKDERKT